MTRVAAIDCGTNSIRLLVADVDPVAGTLVDRRPRRMEIVRLGQGVDRTGRLAAEALERTVRRAATTTPRAIASAGAERVRFVATSRRPATRRTATSSSPGCATALGVEPEVVSGDEEAALSFAGATRELRRPRSRRPYLVVDIGGGSTEFVLGDAAGVRPRARSTSAACG